MFILNYENTIQFAIEIEVKSRGHLLASPPSIIKCQDVGIREYGIRFYRMILKITFYL